MAIRLGSARWTDSNEGSLQTRLPHARVTVSLATATDAAQAIRTMQVRGAPLIGATAAFGLALALRGDASERSLAEAHALAHSSSVRRG